MAATTATSSLVALPQAYSNSEIALGSQLHNIMSASIAQVATEPVKNMTLN